MPTVHKKRTRYSSLQKEGISSNNETVKNGSVQYNPAAGDCKKHLNGKATKGQQESESVWSSKWVAVLNVVVGVIVMLGISGAHSWLVYQLHENNLWFTNIKEVEREISFRTESGLYYSYYKQIILSKSFYKGVQSLMSDKLTEHPDTINVLERMNVYQEVILAGVYKLLNLKMEPILFYIYSIFGLQILLVSGLYLMAWLLSGSWLTGLLSAALYIFNRLDTTRVANTGPLRENFALPFIWLQASALVVYFSSASNTTIKWLSLVSIAVCTFLFCLFWQFNQFIMMLQAFSLFGVWILGLLPAQKVWTVMLIQLGSLLFVYVLQFGNSMVIGSLAVSFLLTALPVVLVLGDQVSQKSVPGHLLKVIWISLLTLVSMVLLNIIIKVVASVDSDEHIFKFLQNKFGVGNERDFDARLYLCLGIFGFITQDVFERLTANWALPLYIPTHLFLLCWLAFSVVTGWSSQSQTSTVVQEKIQKTGPVEKQKFTQNVYSSRPDLTFHTVQAVFFGALSMLTLRMKYFWTPYVCVFAAVGVGDMFIWTQLLQMLGVKNSFLKEVVRSSVVILILGVMINQLLPPVLEELKVETEFWDPDTVELMEWIKANTKTTASFTGSMQLLAGVKLCTDRPITNHPHYEDKDLRVKTKQLYQIYGRKCAADVHTILKKYDSNFIILEDSICRAPSKGGCRTPDLVDISNGEMPDVPVNMSGLVEPVGPRFCEAVRHQKPPYSKFFRSVLVNKTFRVYKVL